DLRAEAGEFEHFLESDAIEPPCIADHARVGGIDSVHVGENLALVRTECGCERHAGGIRAAATERGDIAFVVDALEAGHDNHPALLQIAEYAILVNRPDASLGVGAVREDADLSSGI